MEFISIACQPMKTIPQIIEAAGGLKAVAEKTGLKDGVRKWPDIGVPDRYWAVLIDLVPGLTPEDLYDANRAAREAAAPAKTGEAA